MAYPQRRTFIFFPLCSMQELEKKAISVGIDVSSATLAVCIEEEPGHGISQTIANSKEGVLRLCEQLTNYKCPVRIVMESTGRYHLLAVLHLRRAGFFVALINPLRLKKYHTSSIRKTKTDKADAQLLAHVAEQEHDLPAYTISEKVILLRAQASYLRAVEQYLQALRAAGKHYAACAAVLEEPELPEWMINAQMSITQLEKNTQQGEKALAREVSLVPEGKETMERTTSIPGCSAFLGALLFLYCSQANGATAGAWVGYLGLDISQRQSGTWNGKGAVTKRGNHFLRKRLYHGAWGAVMNNARWKEAYYDLKKEGRAHPEALMILSRKLLKVAYGVVKNNMFYDEQLCFSKKE